MSQPAVSIHKSFIDKREQDRQDIIEKMKGFDERKIQVIPFGASKDIMDELARAKKGGMNAKENVERYKKTTHSTVIRSGRSKK